MVAPVSGCVVQHQGCHAILHPDLAVLEVLEEPGRNPIDETGRRSKAPAGPSLIRRLSYSSKIGPRDPLMRCHGPLRNQSPLKMPGYPAVGFWIRIAPNVFKIGIVGPS